MRYSQAPRRDARSTNPLPLPATRKRILTALAGMLACTLLASLAAGCDEDPALVTTNNSNMIFVDGMQEFHQKVELSDKPVMVDFFKASCPTCVVQEGWMNDFAEEYKGRVVFVRMRIRDSAMNSVCPEVMEKYKLFWVPTEALFVNGQMKQKWELNHLPDEFREAINDALLQQSKPKPLEARPAAAAPPAGSRLP